MSPDVATLILTALTKHLVSIGLDKTVQVLREFAREMNADERADNSENKRIELPTAGIIGIGRCGTHIALDLANTIYLARQQLNQANQDPPPEQKQVTPKPAKTERSLLSLLPFLPRTAEADDDSQLLLIDPVILAADLDGNVRGTVDHSNIDPKRDTGIRFALTDLTWLQKGGAGNIPIVAQYLATLALLVPDERLPADAKSWRQHRSYFIESAGLDDNASRLFIFLFSCGGGSGSGMASVLGLAQQNAMVQNILGRPREEDAGPPAGQFKIAEPICSLGIGILPELTTIPSAQQLNAGRLLCRFLAQQNRFDLKKETSEQTGGRTRIFNCLLLVSNWTMLKSFGNQKDDATTSVSRAESMANHYIGQQIFNLLSAQAMITDYAQGQAKAFLDEAGIADTIRLDANDLNNSLSGPTAVAYAEGFTTGGQSFVDLLFRALGMPVVRKEESLIEGISILPTSPEKYKELLSKQGEDLWSGLGDLKLFSAAFSTVCVISVPNLGMLQMKEVLALRDALERLFPNAKIKRYAIVQGSSRNPSLTLFTVGSACLTYEAYNHVLRYITNCFATDGTALQTVDDGIRKLLAAEIFDPKSVLQQLRSVESLDRVLVGVSGSAGQWDMNKLTYEKRFASYLPKAENGGRISPQLEIDQLLVTQEEVGDALEYMYRVQHQVSPVGGLADAF